MINKIFAVLVLCAIANHYFVYGSTASSKVYKKQPIAVVSDGNLYALANIHYSGWYKIAKSAEEIGYSGRRGGFKVTVTAAGNWLGPSQQIIYGFKNWTNLLHLSSVSDALTGFFTKYRIVVDNNTAYLEGYIPSLMVGDDSYFFVSVESIGLNPTNWEPYTGGLTPGLTNPIAVSQLNVASNSTSFSSVGVSEQLGIGTSTPSKKLDVWSSPNSFAASFGGSLSIGQWSGIHFGYKEEGNDNYKQAGLVFERTAYNPHAPGKIHLLNTTSYQSATLADAKVTIDEIGNMGIGTVTPSEKLSVNGNIKAKKLIISQNSWPDYVFDSSYSLRTLSEVGKFIAKNKHLPEMPSAKEVEEKGINVGDNQALLLKKIEELTLYIIRMDQEHVASKKEIQELKKKIEQFEKYKNN